MTNGAMAFFKARLAEVARDVDEALAALLSRAVLEPGSEGGSPERLSAAMRHAVLGAGKRLRPFLSSRRRASSDAPTKARSSPAARSNSCMAIRWCMTTCLRWMMTICAAAGRPCTRPSMKRPPSSPAMPCSPLAFEVMASAEIDREAARRVELIAALARAAGAAGMVGGQMLDLSAEARAGRGEPPVGEKEIAACRR